MATTALAYGLIPVYSDGGQTRAKKYNILNNSGTGYGTSIYKGDIVKVGTNGTIEIGDGTSPALGVFQGCEYIDATGKPTESAYWPASTAVLSGSDIIAYVIDDQNTTYRVGVTANASGYDQTVVGQQCNVTVAAGNVNTGVSGWSVTTAAITAGTLAQVRIEGYVDGIYNATTNPFPQLLVKLVEVQFAPNAVGV